MKKILIILLSVIFAVSLISFSGCKTETATTTAAAETTAAETTAAETTATETTEAPKQLKIASAVMNLAWPWFLGTVEGMENIVKEKGNIDFTWEDSKFEINTQVQQLENFMQMGVDGVIIYPVDAKAIIPTMVDLSKAGIKLVVGDYPQETDKESDIVWETFVGHDFKEMGKAAGVIAVEYLKTLNNDKPVCAWVSIPATGQSSIDRFTGFEEVVLAAFPDAEIIEQGDTTGNRDSAQTTFENLLQVTPKIDVVSGHNDAVVLGAFAAAQTQGRDEMKFIGLAGDKEVLGYVQDGNSAWLGEILQDPVVLGETCMRALLDALDGKELDVRYPIPLPEGITSKNINEYDWKSWAWLGK